MHDLIEKSILLEKYPLSILISSFERNDMNSIQMQANTITQIQNIKRKSPALTKKSAVKRQSKSATIIGWTGMPGVGKSSLLHTVCMNLFEKQKDIRIGILAIDPTSHISGGSFLGDRTRVKFPVKDKRIFFRSQPTELILGGLGKYTFPVTILMQEIFDILFIETVGIGQNEIEIKLLSEFVTLIIQPFAGDEVQFMKAGIMEIPDIFVLNKCDETSLSESSYQKLVYSLRLDYTNNIQPPIFKTSALNQKGITKLSEHIFDRINQNSPENLSLKLKEKKEYFVKKSVKEKYGEYGINILLDIKKKEEKCESNYFESLLTTFSEIEMRIK